MIITKVQKNEGKTYSVYIDGEFSFNVSQYDIHKLAIYEERELNKEDLAWIKHQARFMHAKTIAVNFLAYKLRTISEVKKKLNEADIDYEIIEEIINYLTENGYLDDEQYVRKFIAEKERLASLSDKVIIYKLREKGIPAEIIESALREGNHDEIDAAKRFIAKRIKGSVSENKLDVKKILYKKGFSAQTINSILNGEEF